MRKKWGKVCPTDAPLSRRARCNIYQHKDPRGLATSSATGVDQMNGSCVHLLFTGNGVAAVRPARNLDVPASSTACLFNLPWTVLSSVDIVKAEDNSSCKRT